MNDHTRDEDAWVERLAAVLREGPDPAAEERVMERVRRASDARAGWRFGLRWLFEPQAVRLRPIIPLAAIPVLAALVLLLRPPVGPVPPAGVSDRVQPAAGPAARPVQFVCLAVGAREVSVVGDFNDWRPEATPLRRSGTQGVWAGLLWLPPGVYEYAFVVDGDLRATDDARPAAPPDEFGVTNSVLIVGQESI